MSGISKYIPSFNLGYWVPASVKKIAGEVWTDACAEAKSIQDEGIEMSNLIQKAATAAKPVIQAGAAAASVVKDAVLHIRELPESPKTLLHITLLLEQLSSKPQDQEIRKELARELANFIHEFKPAENDAVQLQALIKTLKKPGPIAREKVDQLARILAPYGQEHGAYIHAKLHRREELKAQLAPIPGALETPPILSKERTLDLIKNELAVLASNMTKMTLCSMVFMKLGISKVADIKGNAKLCEILEIVPVLDEKTDLMALLLTNSKKSTPKEFNALLENIIKNSDAGIISCMRARFYLSISSLISSYITTLFAKLEAAIVAFIDLNSTDQLREVLALCVDPLIHHLEHVEGKFEKDDVLSDQLALRNPEKIAARLAEIFKAEGMSKTDLKSFINAFLSQFTSPLHVHRKWMRQLQGFLTEKVDQSRIVAYLAYYPLIAIVWVVDKFLDFIYWTIDKTMRLALKILIVNLFPTLMQSSKKAVQIGEVHTWFSLKNSLLIKLRQLELILLSHKNDPGAQLAREDIPADITDKFVSVIDHLKKVLDLQDPDKIRAIPFFDSIKTPAAEAIAQQMIREGVLPGMILTALQSTNTNGFSPKAPVSEEDKICVETELNEELGHFIDLAIEDNKEDYRADRREQAQANAYVNKLNSLGTTFGKEVEREYRRSGLKNVARLEALHQNFMGSVQKLSENLLTKLDASTQRLLSPYQLEAVNRGRQLGVLIEHLKSPEAHAKRVTQMIQQLDRRDLTREMAQPILDHLIALNSPIANASAVTEIVHRFFAEQQNPAALSQSLRAHQIRVIEKARDLRNILARQTVDLMNWSRGLAYVQTTVQPTTTDVAATKVVGLFQTLAPYNPIIKSYVASAFKLLGQGFHLDGFVHRTIVAYTTKPALPKPSNEVYVPQRPIRRSPKISLPAIITA